MPHFVCECGCVFNDHSAFYERNDDALWMTCPECGRDTFETAAYCYRCGKPFRYGDLRGGYYCDECMDEMTEPYHMKQFIKEEIDSFAEFLHEQRQDEQPKGVSFYD